MTVMTRRAVILSGLAAGVIAYAGFRVLSAGAAEAGKIYAVDGVALGGTDPVAYFKQGAPVQGSAANSVDWSGATWHFANAQNKADFEANPAAFAPQYGGFCAWAIAAKGQFFATEPERWAIVDGRLFLNFNEGVQTRWNADRPGFISKGDERWPQLLAAEQL